MVSTYRITNIRFLAILLAEFHTQLCVWHLHILIADLTNIVQQTRTTGFLNIQAQLRSHSSTEVSRLAGVHKQVLTITGAILHLTNQANQLGMHTVDTKVNRSTFTCFDNLFLYLFGHFSHNLLNTCRVDTSVLHQLVKRQARNLTANRVKCRKRNRLWCIIYHNFYTCGSLQGTDITSLTTNNTTLNFIIINMEHRYSILHCSLRGDTLDRLDNNLLSLFIGSEARLIHGVIDVCHGSRLGLIFEGIHELLLCLFRRET